MTSDAPAPDCTHADDVLALAPISDLLRTDAKQRNVLVVLAIVAEIEIECGQRLDFVVPAGD